MKELLEERAAIKEFSGNIPRPEAERQAKAENEWCVSCKSAGVMLDRLQSTRRRLATLEKAAAGIPIRVTVSAVPGSAVSADG